MARINYHRYTSEQIQFLRDSISCHGGYTYAELAALFNKRFGTDISGKKIMRICHKYRISIGRIKQCTDEQIQFLKDNADRYTYEELADLYGARFATRRPSDKTIKRMCRRYGIHKKCCYHRPYPKGIPLNCSQEHIEFIRENAWGKSKPVLADLFNKHFGTAISAERMQQICRTLNISSGITQGKGHGRPDGYEFISYGRIFVKVTANKWKEKQRAVWEAANGPVPKGHKIMFADGNNLNCNLDNLLLVSDRERTTMYHHNLRSPDPEMTKIGKDIAKLRIAISDSLKEKKHRRKSRDRRSL